VSSPIKAAAQVDELTRHIVEANAETIALRQEWYEALRTLTVGGEG